MELHALGLSEVYRQGKPAISFELFPPKTDGGMESLFEHLKELARCKPAFIPCTYGAGGSPRERTLEVLRSVRASHPHIPIGSHLTCVGSTRDDWRGYIRRAIAAGVDRIVALRGDPPQGETAFQPVEDGLSHAEELVRLLRASYPELGVIVAGYPETHPAAPSLAKDLEYLKRKVDAGADAVVTQLFYDNGDYFRFRDRCADAGITVPIVPGLLPVTNLAQIKRITGMCGAHLTQKLVRRLEVHGDDDEGQFSVGVYHAARQAEELIEQGAPGIHFYVLNKSRAAALICRALALFTPVE